MVEVAIRIIFIRLLYCWDLWWTCEWKWQRKTLEGAWWRWSQGCWRWTRLLQYL